MKKILLAAALFGNTLTGSATEVPLTNKPIVGTVMLPKGEQFVILSKPTDFSCQSVTLSCGTTSMACGSTVMEIIKNALIFEQAVCL